MKSRATVAGPSEASVRSELRRWLQQFDEAEIVDEFWVPRSNERADLALVGPLLAAFEIKTARDSLSRLPRQADAYARIFDSCTAVVAERHMDATRELLPAWWGLVLIDHDASRPRLEWVRESRSNPGRDSETLVRLLWKEEVRRALENLGESTTSGATRRVLWQELLAKTTQNQLCDVVRAALIARDPASARIPSNRFKVKRLAADH